MKKEIIGVFVCSLLIVNVILLVTTYPTIADLENDGITHTNITYTYSFERPSVHYVTIAGTEYVQVELFESLEAGNPGEPKLPAYGVRLLLPKGTEVANIDIIGGERVSLGAGFIVEPVGEPVKLSEINSVSTPACSKSIYMSNDIYPQTLFTEVGTYAFRGYEIFILLLYPVHYIPSPGKLFYYKDITVVVTTKETDQANPLFRHLEKDELAVNEKVDNLEAIQSYTENTNSVDLSETYDLLILTTDDFKERFQPLKSAHDATGITTEIKTLRDISPFPGFATPEDIRDFIRKEYINHGIEYVLIGGDVDIVPAKNLWVQTYSGGDNTIMPSDLYYACLDGTFNYDNDDEWGEPKDGENGTDVDLVAEVYVGRACVGSLSEVDHFVNKTITYMNYGGYSNGTALFVGEYLWSDPDTYGDDYMDELINGSHANGYITVGIPSTKYTIDKLYDRIWPDWPTSEIISRINNGARIINHHGHAYYGYDLRMVNDDVNSLTNTNPCFIYSQGCMAGGFDDPEGYDCIAEYFTVKTEQAAFAVIMNARYGWGVVGSTDGASQRYHRQFWDAIFGEEIMEIGKANQDSKEDNIPNINGACMRWCYYELNLFGDPTLTFIPTNNTQPAKTAKPSGTRIGKVGQMYQFISSTTDVDGDKIYYKWSFGDGNMSKWLGPFTSGQEINISYNWSYIGFYNVQVKARDEHRAESDWSEPLIVFIGRTTFLCGRITNLTNQNQIISFNAVHIRARTFIPWTVNQYTTGEKIVVSEQDYPFHIVNNYFIFGRFNTII
jgi:hypothetical protein